MKPPLLLADGTVEALKWLALGLMVLDHVNQYLCDGSLPWAFSLGRLAFPLFAFVLAYNLARPQVINNGAAVRTMKRLAIFALIAAIPHVALDGRWLPVNILATLLVATGVIVLFEQGGLKSWQGLLAFMLGGYFVEGNWFAIAMCITAYYYCKSKTVPRFLSVIVSLVMLGLFINTNQWALAVLPVIFGAPHVTIKINRHRNVFYWFYPAHLAVIALLKKTIE